MEGEDKIRKETKSKKRSDNDILKDVTKEKKADSFSCSVGEDKLSLDQHKKSSHVKDEMEDKDSTLNCKLCSYSTENKKLLRNHISKKHKKTMKAYKSDIAKHDNEENMETNRAKEIMNSSEDEYEENAKVTDKNLYDSFAEETNELLQNIEKEQMDVDEDISEESSVMKPEIGAELVKPEDCLQAGQCLKCHRKFITKESMAEHFRTMYPSEKYHCPDQSCDERFEEKESVKNHVNTYHKEMKYKCLICNIEFTKENVLRNHNKRKHSVM